MCWASRGNKISVAHPKQLLLLSPLLSSKWCRYPDGTVCIWIGVHLECSPIIEWCWLKCKPNPSTALLLYDFHPGPGCHLFPGPLQQTQWLFWASLLLPKLTHLLIHVYEKLNQYTSTKNFLVASYCPWKQMQISQLWPHRWHEVIRHSLLCSLPRPCFISQHSLFTLLHLPENLWAQCSRTQASSPRPWPLPFCSWGMSSWIPTSTSFHLSPAHPSVHPVPFYGIS